MADNVLSIVLNAETEKAQKAIEDFAKKFDVEIKGAVSVYDSFEKKIKEVETALKNSKSPEEVAKLTTKLREAKGAFNEIKTGQFSTGLNNATKSLTGTNTALTNFGRVIQDAPFGILGVANNIDPLIASFQNLKKETGSTGGALKALLSGLTGPAGIAIAVSAATSAFIAFGPEIAAFFNIAQNAGDAAKAAAEGFNSAAKSVSNEAAEVEKLVAVLKSETTSRGEKQSAINELNRVSSIYFNGLTLEGEIVKGLDPAYKSYVSSLLNVARAKAAQTKISELYTKRLELESTIIGDVLTSALNKAATANAKIDKAFKNQQEVGFVSLGLTKDEQAAFAANSQIVELDRQISKLAAATIPAFDKEAKNAAAATNSITDANKKLNESFVVSERVFSDNLTAVTKYTTALQYLRDIEAERLRIAQQKASDEFTKKIVTEGSFAPAKLLENVKPVALVGKSTEELDNLTAINNKVADIKNNFALLGPIIDASFNALSGGENAVEGLKAAIKSLIIQLLKAAALAAIISIATGGAAGGGTSFLSAFKSILGLPGKAQGGTVNSGSPYIVGENGPELFVPTGSGNIVSNGRFGNMGGGGGTLSARVSGGDLLFILNQAGNNRSVNFG